MKKGLHAGEHYDEVHTRMKPKYRKIESSNEETKKTNGFVTPVEGSDNGFEI